jgi:choice-of-anchor B domain-containing protein
MDGPYPDGLLSVTARYSVGDTQTVLASHNISINEDTGFAYLTGATLAAGLEESDEPVWILELEGDTSGEFPLPKEAGVIDSIFGEEIDSHDAHVLTYDGPDDEYDGREIAIIAAGANLRLGIYDVTDKEDIKEISAPTYDGASFTHQAWMSADGNWIFMGDEEDEVFGISDPRNPNLPDTTRIYVWDAQELEAPYIYCTFDTPWAAIDHNLFEHDGKLYLANYTAGFVVFDVSDLDSSEDNCNVDIVGYMDTEPRLPTNHMNRNINIFVGPWGIYPYFESGKIIVSDGLNGLIIARLEAEED